MLNKFLVPADDDLGSSRLGYTIDARWIGLNKKLMQNS